MFIIENLAFSRFKFLLKNPVYTYATIFFKPLNKKFRNSCKQTSIQFCAPNCNYRYNCWSFLTSYFTLNFNKTLLTSLPEWCIIKTLNCYFITYKCLPAVTLLPQNSLFVAYVKPFKLHLCKIFLFQQLTVKTP